MPDDKSEAPEAEDAGGGKNKLLIVLVVTNLLVVLGAGAAVFFAMGSPSQSAEAETDGEPEPVGPLLELQAMVVNLDEPERTAFLRAGFQLELSDAEAQPQVEARLVPLRSAMLLHLSGMTVEDTVGREQREQVLESLRDVANEQLGGELVRRVHFTEFVVQ
ncbi:MAG TPA: flagellar basal body-associated FliL family protein [Sandaracinaceae bacterium LLY-WYZ-13_1]|nr:flagellar basal body-associated FliL family protein [Sandaracinaceae bacterium LLY-WYZ-13_1]